MRVDLKERGGGGRSSGSLRRGWEIVSAGGRGDDSRVGS